MEPWNYPGFFYLQFMLRNIITLFLLHFSLSAITQNKQHNNIRFEFTTEENAKEPEFFGLSTGRIGNDMFLVKCSLINPNPDTVYFLAKTCDYIQSLLVFDDSIWQLSPRMECYVIKCFSGIIPPGGKFEFNGYLKSLKKTTKLRLAFDFYELGRIYSIDDPDLQKIWYDHITGIKPLIKKTIAANTQPL